MTELDNKIPKIDLSGFPQDEVKQVCLEKLSELENRVHKLIQIYNTKNLYLTLKNERQFSYKWLVAYSDLYQFEAEREKLETWKRYWKRLGQLDPPVEFKDGYTKEEIQRAREFPIQELLTTECKKAGGGKLKTLCPFHVERTPSFVVYPDQSYHCFSCHQHGWNCLDFLMQLEEIDFKEAVTRLIN